MIQDSCILWEGESCIDGSPIVCLLTGLLKNSANPKTGAMIQSWIIPATNLPLTAAKEGKDTGVCGDCPLKPTNNNSCYVNLVNVNNVYRKYRRGGYEKISKAQTDLIELLKLKIRLGAYGDPAAIPFTVWEKILSHCSGHTGYTHQWHNCDRRFAKIIMASVESHEDGQIAQSMGWRTFRIFHPKCPSLRTNEIICPNVENPSIQCKDCRLCDGNSSIKANIASPVHGLGWKTDNFKKLSVSQKSITV